VVIVVYLRDVLKFGSCRTSAKQFGRTIGLVTAAKLNVITAPSAHL